MSEIIDFIHALPQAEAGILAATAVGLAIGVICAAWALLPRKGDTLPPDSPIERRSERRRWRE